MQALLDELEACMLAIGLSVVPPPTLNLDAIEPSALLPSVPALPSPAAAAHAPGNAAFPPLAIADDESGGSLRSSFDQPALQAADSGDSGADFRHRGTHRHDDETPGRKRRRKGSGGRGAKVRRVAKTPEDDDDFIVDDDDIDEEEAEDLIEPSSEADSDLPSIAASGSDLDSEPEDGDEVVSSAEEEGGGRDGGGRAAEKRRKRGVKSAKRGAAGAANPGLKVLGLKLYKTMHACHHSKCRDP